MALYSFFKVHFNKVGLYTQLKWVAWWWCIATSKFQGSHLNPELGLLSVT